VFSPPPQLEYRQMIIPSEYDKHAHEVRGTVTNRGALAAVRRLCSTFSGGMGMTLSISSNGAQRGCIRREPYVFRGDIARLAQSLHKTAASR